MSIPDGIILFAGDSPENKFTDRRAENFCSSTVTDDDKDYKMPAVLMVSDDKVNGDSRGESIANRLDCGISNNNNNSHSHLRNLDEDNIKRETLDISSNHIGSDNLCSDRDNLWSPAASSDSGCSNQPLNMTGHGLLPSQVSLFTIVYIN